MSTSRGLFRWTPSSRLLRRYGVQQGIGSQEFLDRAITLTEEGMLAAATADGGLVLVDTTTAQSAPASPVLRLAPFAVPLASASCRDRVCQYGEISGLAG